MASERGDGGAGGAPTTAPNAFGSLSPSKRSRPREVDALGMNVDVPFSMGSNFSQIEGSKRHRHN